MEMLLTGSNRRLKGHINGVGGIQRRTYVDHYIGNYGALNVTDHQVIDLL